jgi:hypothetical protein
MEMFYDSSQALLEALYPNYSTNSKALISRIGQDKKLSQFDTFNKRLKISWGMRIEFNDNLPIKDEDTRACYMLMLKISDLWFAFEHLVQTSSELIPTDAPSRSSVDLYRDSTLAALGFPDITSHFNRLLYTHVLHKPNYRKEMYRLLAYLKNNTKGGTKNAIADTIARIKEKQELQTKHIFALAYGIRNVYVHKGVAAALGSKNYRLKRVLYSILYDSLILYSLALGDAYCRKYSQGSQC